MWASPAEIPVELKSTISAFGGMSGNRQAEAFARGMRHVSVISVAVFPGYPGESKGQFQLLTARFFPPPMSSC